MPVVQVYMYMGRSKEVANITPESLHILFHDVNKEDWGTRSTLASDPPPK